MAMMSGPKRQRSASPFLDGKAAEQAVAVIVAKISSLYREKDGGEVQRLTEKLSLIGPAGERRARHFIQGEEIESLQGLRDSIESRPTVTVTTAMNVVDGDANTIIRVRLRGNGYRRQDRVVFDERGCGPTPTGKPEHAGQCGYRPEERFAES